MVDFERIVDDVRRELALAHRAEAERAVAEFEVAFVPGDPNQYYTSTARSNCVVSENGPFFFTLPPGNYRVVASREAEQAALMRARGIPSRVALGFASVGRGVFIGHAWTEAWLDPGRGWVGVDAGYAINPNPAIYGIPIEVVPLRRPLARPDPPRGGRAPAE